MATTSAVEMALARGVDPKRFRTALRRAGLEWHAPDAPWIVRVGSPEHADMQRVLDALVQGQGAGPSVPVDRSSARATRADSDEAWIIDTCDALLGVKACRQYRFPFLLGDPGPSGHRVRLPVDAFYPELRLVIEYHERQHTEEVKLFDERMTVSGVGRGEQRRRYDAYRRTLLPQQGYSLLVFDYSEFEHTGNGRLIRNDANRKIVRLRLRDYRT